MLSIKRVVKVILNDTNELSYVDTLGNWLSYHDTCHIECSKLTPVLMLGEQVTGINGIPIAEFNRKGLTSDYSPYLDECRVAIHQWCKTPTKLISIVRLAYWVSWLVLKGENPIRVILSHVNSMR